MRILLTLVMVSVFSVSVKAAVVSASNSEQAIQFIRSFFDEDTSAPSRVSAVALNHSRPSLSRLTLLNDLKFEPKDIWGNRDYVFGYGLLSDGSTVLFAWKASPEAPSISLKELSGIYEDDRMASIQDEKDLKRWKKMREIVAGSFIGVRKSEMGFNSLYPAEESSDLTGRASLTTLMLEKEPLIVKFTVMTPEKRTKPLLASVEEPLPLR